MKIFEAIILMEGKVMFESEHGAKVSAISLIISTWTSRSMKSLKDRFCYKFMWKKNTIPPTLSFDILV